MADLSQPCRACLSVPPAPHRGRLTPARVVGGFALTAPILKGACPARAAPVAVRRAHARASVHHLVRSGAVSSSSQAPCPQGRLRGSGACALEGLDEASAQRGYSSSSLDSRPRLCECVTQARRAACASRVSGDGPQRGQAGSTMFWIVGGAVVAHFSPLPRIHDLAVDSVDRRESDVDRYWCARRDPRRAPLSALRS